jgi:hypothetical protein
MQCLSNGDEINAIISKSGPFSRKYFVSNVIISRLCGYDLLPACITGYSLLKYSERVTACHNNVIVHFHH